MLPVRRDDGDIGHPFERDLLARLHDRVLAAFDRFQVGRVERIRLLAFFDRRTVVNEFLDWQFAHQLHHAANMVDVEMRDQDIIELLDLGVLGDLGDSSRVAAAKSGPARVHEHGLARRRDDQRGLAAFHVHEIQFQILRRRQQGQRAREQA